MLKFYNNFVCVCVALSVKKAARYISENQV